MQVKQKSDVIFGSAVLVKFKKEMCPWTMANEALNYAVKIKNAIDNKGLITLESTDAVDIMVVNGKEKDFLSKINSKYVKASEACFIDFNEQADKLAEYIKNKSKKILNTEELVDRLNNSAQKRLNKAKEAYKKAFNQIANDKTTTVLNYEKPNQNTKG